MGSAGALWADATITSIAAGKSHTAIVAGMLHHIQDTLPCLPPLLVHQTAGLPNPLPLVSSDLLLVGELVEEGLD
jgi:hypothetical protein